MKRDSFKARLKAALLSAMLCTGLLALVSCSRPAGYRAFVRHDQQYYAQFATACDALISQNATGSAYQRELTSDDQSLPIQLRDLHPSHLVVSSNAVLVTVGYGWDSYGIGWSPNEHDPSLWELKIGLLEGESRRILYSRRSP